MSRPSGAVFRPRCETLEDRAVPAVTVLDPAFGTAGKAITDFAGRADAATAVARTPDGDLLVAGPVGKGANHGDFGLVRYHANGQLDLTFGTNGRATADFAADLQNPVALRLQGDGQIVVVGTVSHTADGSRDIALARFDAEGTLDPTFGTGGLTVTDLGVKAEDATDAVVLADGQILVAARRDLQAVLLRYDADGTQDLTFGTAGRVLLNPTPGAFLDLGKLAVQADGKILVSGGYTDPTTALSHHSDFYLARFDADGQADTAFGTDGVTLTDLGGVDAVTALGVEADGTIVAAGRSSQSLGIPGGPAKQFLAYARYQADGTLDDTFGTGGTLRTLAGNTSGAAVDGLALPADGKVIALTDVWTGTAHQLNLTRLTAQGTVDAGFGSSGKVPLDFRSAGAVLLQPDGRLVVAGGTRGGDFVTARYRLDVPASPVDHPPVAHNDQATTQEDTPVAIAVLANDSDPDHDPLTLTVLNATHGTATVDDHGTPADPHDDRILFTPDAHYHGLAQVAYLIDDGQGGTATATVQITVQAVNAAPVGQADAYQVLANGKLTVSAAKGVLANDSDPDGDKALKAVKDTGPAHGTLTLGAAGNFTYVPTAGFTGTDTFTYKVSDGKLASEPVTVTLTVTPPVTVEGVTVNGGEDQRSMVTSLAVTFSGVTELPAGTFQVQKMGGGLVGLNVATAVTGGKTVATLTFKGAGIVGGSLADGNYKLTVRGNPGLDGDGDGKGGGNFTTTLFRFFGDADGDRTVSADEQTAFNAALGHSAGGAGFVAYFDYQGNGAINASDAAEFAKRAGKTLKP